MLFSPFSPLQGAWSKRDNPNMKFIWYEEIKHRQRDVLRDLSVFVGHPLSEDKITELIGHTSIESMRKIAGDRAKDEESKAKAEKFFRKGKVGDWKNHFDEDGVKEWDRWIEDNVKGTDIAEEFQKKTGAKFY